MEDQRKTKRIKCRDRYATVLLVAFAAICALAPTSATADSTHPFLGYINAVGGGGIEPEGTDADGNLIVWLNDQQVVAKYDVNGNPVNFAGLGTNKIDGAGGFDCPHTPADCDRVATNGFGSGSTNGVSRNIVAVDNSGGPANGYIYVENNTFSDPYQEDAVAGEVDVFNADGVYVGKIDQTQAYPRTVNQYDPAANSVSVAANGAVYIDHEFTTLSNIDRYVPVDGNPAHDQFVGQIIAKCADTVACASNNMDFDEAVGGVHYAYGGGLDRSHSGSGNPSYYSKYPLSAFHWPGGLFNGPPSIDFSPDVGPFGNGGASPVGGGSLYAIAIDPKNEDVYIGRGSYTNYPIGIQQWDENNHQIGPNFGGPQLVDASVDTIALDRTGGPTDGRIYVRGPASNQIAVFGPPIPLPDITVDPATTGHTTAHLSATIDLAGGPNVTNCHIEYGLTTAYAASPVPCDAPTPYSSTTSIGANLSGLLTEADYHYRIAATTANGTEYSKDHVFHTHAVLGVTADPVSDLSLTGATLNGSLNPDGMDTTYHFEYGASTSYKLSTPKVDGGAGSGETAVDPTPVTQLQSGKTYHVRLVASNSLGTTKGPDLTFVVPAKPAISGVRAENVADSSADLAAKIQTFGYGTTYHFEYGTTPNYGQNLPPVDAGNSALFDASAHLVNLQSGVTYHFRIIATNQWGTSTSPDSTFNFYPPQCPNQHVRQLTGAAFLPDCRAYELVSPSDAGGVTLFPGDVSVEFPSGGVQNPPFYLRALAPNPSGLATDPSRFGFFGGEGAVTGLHPPNSYIDRYVATRTNEGWTTTYPGTPGDQVKTVGMATCDQAMDKCIDYRMPGIAELTADGSLGPSMAPYVWDISGKSLGRWPTNLAIVPNGEHFVGDTAPSADFTHFVFSSNNFPFAPGGLESAPGSAYDNDIAADTVQIVSKLPNGDPIPQDGGSDQESIQIDAVSTNGSHILMSTQSAQGNRNFYMRLNDSVTYAIGEGNFVGMTSSGSKVILTSAEQLTPDDTDNSVDMYVWDDSTQTLTRVSQGNGAGNSDDCNASWAGACDVQPIAGQRPDLDDRFASESGDVYFYSPEQLDPANPGIKNERNLYDYRDGQVHLVTTLDPGTQVDRLQISPDGSHMAFLTNSKVTGYDSQGWEEMYTYNPADGNIICASCIPTGQPPAIPHSNTTFGDSGTNMNVAASESGRFMSNDGRVAFSTSDALISGDTNQKIDVYEFVDNRPQLITQGTGDRDTQGGTAFYPTTHTGFEGISQSGLDLYFSTYDTLVPQDRNGSFVKFYDARTDGGFPIPTTLLPCTAADECHGDGSLPPASPQIGTSANLGQQTATSSPTTRPTRRHKRRRHRRHPGNRHQSSRNVTARGARR